MYFLWEDLLADSAREAVIGTVPDVVRNSIVRFDAGMKITQAMPELRMVMSEKIRGYELTDNLLTYSSWAIIVSERMKQLLINAGVDNIDWYTLIIENEKTGQEVKNYWVGNIIGIVDCVDWEKAIMDDEKAFFRRLWLDEKKIHNLRIFRLAGYEHHVIVHESVKRAIESTGYTGVEFPVANGYCDEGVDPVDEDNDNE